MKVLMVLQIFRKDFGTSQAACGFDNCSVPIRDTKSSMGRKCGKHEIERHLLDGKTGPRGNQLNGDLRVDPRSTRARGLDVKFLKDLNGKSKIGSQKYLPGDRPFSASCSAVLIAYNRIFVSMKVATTMKFFTCYPTRSFEAFDF